MPSYQLLRRPVGEGGFLAVAIAASSLPANSLPQGETRQEVGGEVGRGRGQRFNRAMRCKGTSLAISVRRTNHCSPWMPTHMQHFSLQTSTYSRTAHRLPLICTPIRRRRWRMACLEWKAGGGVERAEVGAEQKGEWGNKGELEMVLNVGARLEEGTESQNLR